MLEVRELRKSFAGFLAVAGVSFSVARAEICALIGPNGAGKSTLFNLITGHLDLDSGQVIFDGRPVTSLRAHQICRLGLGRSFQRSNIFPRLTVFENVQAAVLSHRGRSLDFWTRVGRLFEEETREILEKVGLADQARAVGGTLSYGFQKQLELGIALASRPKMLLLDEPTAGMSARETRATIELIGRITREEGLTLLFTEHDMSVVFSIAERIMVLSQGRLIASGRPDEVRENEAVRQVYFGEAGCS